MSVNRTPIVGTHPEMDDDDNQLLAFIIQNVAQSVNVVNDTVSIVRREADVFYDSIPIDRLRPDTNGPRVVMNDCQATVDRITSQIAKAYFEERSVEAVSYNEDDKEAADQCTKITRHAIFALNNGKILIRDSIKGAAKYPFGGAMRIVRCDHKEYEKYSMYLENATSMEEAEQLARMIAVQNTKEDYIVWKLRKIRQEKYEIPLVVEGVPIINDKGKQQSTESIRFCAKFDIERYTITHDIHLIPPEEFLINKSATCVDDAVFVAQRHLMPRTDILEMFPEAAHKLGEGEQQLSYTASYNTGFSNEKQYRRRLHNTLNITSRPALSDPSMNEALVVEGYIRYDWYKDGHAVWMHFAMVNNMLLHREEWNGPLPYILPNLNRDPYRPDEVTILERAKDSQLAKTAILRSDIKAHQARNALQIIARTNGFPLSGQRKLLEGTPGIVPFGNNEQGSGVGNSIGVTGPINDHVLVLQKPDPSQASVPMLGYIDQQKASSIGVNNLNDVAGAHQSRINPATNAAIQQRQQDIAIEDLTMVYGETAMKPLFQKMWWFITQDATHPAIEARFIKLTGKPCLDIQNGDTGECEQRNEFEVNVGLGVDSPEYQQTKAMTMLQLLQAFNQSMSSMMPNLLRKCFYAYQEATKSLGYDPDVMLMTKQEFDQYFQALLQEKQQPQQPDPTLVATVELLKAQAAQQNADAQNKLAAIPKLTAEANKNQAQANKEQQEAIHTPERIRLEAESAHLDRQAAMQTNRENNASKERTVANTNQSRENASREANFSKERTAQNANDSRERTAQQAQQFKQQQAKSQSANKGTHH